jgi:uncharacterized membrane protein (UPF0182 family)
VSAWTAPGSGMLWKRLAIPVALALVALIALGRASDVTVDWLWFSAIGHGEVFWTVITAEAILFLAVFAVSAGALFLSGWLALRNARPRLPWSPGITFGRGLPESLPELIGPLSPRLGLRLAVAGAAIVLGAIIAAGEMRNWDLALRFLHQLPYGERDPVFGKDIGFYLFSLPAYVALRNWLLLLLLLSAALAGIVYWAHGDIRIDRPPGGLSSAALRHASALLGLFFALKAWSYGLDRFLLLYDDNGVVVGAGYTDLHVELPVLWFLLGLAAAAAVACWANMRWRTYRIPLGAAAVLVASSIVLSLVFPALFERLYVKPSELRLEAPYIARNIALTREAYDLDTVTVKPFPIGEGLSLAALEADRATVDNIRLWDWRPLRDTYAQLQEIRTYYKFLDMDIDRYRPDGTYQQVMLSARELEPSLLPANAQTWVNRHLIFTHGNGVVMSPVTEKSAEGLPIFYLQDIPPVASGGPAIRQPRVYFGQAGADYVIVKTGTPEFDYPKGADNVYATYDGGAGIPIGGLMRRSLFAWYFGDANILLTGYITADSRILIRRNIRERVRRVVPFLRLDSDPYIVVSDGRLYWIQDAYTTSSWFPYAPADLPGGANYIRNPVKVVIDAYNGTVDFYVSDPRDPILRTYESIFPRLFKPLSAMPSDLRQHIRYPEDFFLIQAELYRAYHMQTPEVFYNREDLWQFPREPAGIDEAGGATRVEPYYMIMRLPGEARAEFVLMQPMVPSQRENMIAWIAARCDPPNYGKLLVYEFPKEKLVYGPFQIEARIQQNTEISQQISLWNQMGSRVIRGHIVVVPIGNSILYVSPLYLRAQAGQLPELKRVIAVYGDRVVMAETLGAALSGLFKQTVPPPTLPSAAAAAAPAAPLETRAREALQHYDRALERLKAGDWSGFGAELDALKPLLEALGHPAGGH